MTRICSVLGLPVEAGTGRRGCLMGPDALRSAGLLEVISELGFEVRDLENLVRPAPAAVSGPGHLEKLPEIVAWTQSIQKAAFELARSDTLPVFLGGDHSMAAGTLTGVTQAAHELDQPQFVLWLDAHPDMNTLASSVSGHLHGVPMAYALGCEGFDGIFPDLPQPLDPKNVCMIGLRSIDPPERQLIRDLGMDVWDLSLIHI